MSLPLPLAGKRLLRKMRKRASPLHPVLTAGDYRSVVNLPPFTEGRARVFGTPVRFSDRDGFLHSVREIFFDKVYRFDARREKPRIVDAGANIGLSIIYFKRLYPDATIVAYEPDNEIFALLQANTGHYEGVELREAAAWTADTELTFFREGSLAGSVAMDYLNRGKEVKVRAERLKTELQKGPVDFLKIDIEGAENSVLFDIEPELSTVDFLFFEYHSVPGQPQRLGELLNLAGRAGFRYVINGAHGPRLPFVEKVAHGFDLQLNVYCFR